MFSLFGSKNYYGVPAGAIYRTTRFPPAFTQHERAVVEAFFGRKDRKPSAPPSPKRKDQPTSRRG